MDKQTWTIAGVISAAVLLVIIILTFNARSREVARLQTVAAEAETALDGLRGTLAQKEADLAALREQLAQAGARITDLQQEKATTAQTRNTLEEGMRAALESKDVTISQLQGKLT